MLVPYEAIGRDEAALRCLLQIHASCAESAGLMRQMQATLQRMDDNIRTIREAVVTTTTRAAATSGGAASGSGAPVVQVHIKESAVSSFWTLLLLLSLAGASSAAAIYLRGMHRSSSTASS